MSETLQSVRNTLNSLNTPIFQAPTIDNISKIINHVSDDSVLTFPSYVASKKYPSPFQVFLYNNRWYTFLHRFLSLQELRTNLLCSKLTYYSLRLNSNDTIQKHVLIRFLKSKKVLRWCTQSDPKFVLIDFHFYTLFLNKFDLNSFPELYQCVFLETPFEHDPTLSHLAYNQLIVQISDRCKAQTVNATIVHTQKRLQHLLENICSSSDFFQPTQPTQAFQSHELYDSVETMLMTNSEESNLDDPDSALVNLLNELQQLSSSSPSTPMSISPLIPPPVKFHRKTIRSFGFVPKFPYFSTFNNYKINTTSVFGNQLFLIELFCRNSNTTKHLIFASELLKLCCSKGTLPLMMDLYKFCKFTTKQGLPVTIYKENDTFISDLKNYFMHFTQISSDSNFPIFNPFSDDVLGKYQMPFVLFIELSHPSTQLFIYQHLSPQTLKPLFGQQSQDSFEVGTHKLMENEIISGMPFHVFQFYPESLDKWILQSEIMLNFGCPSPNYKPLNIFELVVSSISPSSPIAYFIYSPSFVTHFTACFPQIYSTSKNQTLVCYHRRDAESVLKLVHLHLQSFDTYMYLQHFGGTRDTFFKILYNFGQSYICLSQFCSKHDLDLSLVLQLLAQNGTDSSNSLYKYTFEDSSDNAQVITFLKFDENSHNFLKLLLYLNDKTEDTRHTSTSHQFFPVANYVYRSPLPKPKPKLQNQNYPNKRYKLNF